LYFRLVSGFVLYYLYVFRRILLPLAAAVCSPPASPADRLRGFLFFSPAESVSQPFLFSPEADFFFFYLSLNFLFLIFDF